MPVTTVTDIVSFILRHRGNSNAFKDFSPEELFNLVSNSMADACVVCDSDCFGRPLGVIIGEIDRTNNRLHIVGIISLHSATMAKFALWLRRQRDKEGFELTAHRRDKFVIYNSEKLLNKLISRYGRIKD